ncbi:MAG: hypothetical protein RJB38_22 [Pseudomonadota bacterium]
MMGATLFEDFIDGSSLRIGEGLSKKSCFAKDFEAAVDRGRTHARKPCRDMAYEILGAEMTTAIEKDFEDLEALLTSLQSLLF